MALARIIHSRAPCAGMNRRRARCEFNKTVAPGRRRWAALEPNCSPRDPGRADPRRARENAHFDTCSMKPTTSPRPKTALRRPASGRLKALHLLLDVLGRRSLRVSGIRAGRRCRGGLVAGRAAAGAHPRPAHAALRAAGEFAKRRRFFRLLERTPPAGIVDFGSGVLPTLLAQSDAALAAANLPRSEVDEDLRPTNAGDNFGVAIRARRAASPPAAVGKRAAAGEDARGPSKSSLAFLPPSRSPFAVPPPERLARALVPCRRYSRAASSPAGHEKRPSENGSATGPGRRAGRPARHSFQRSYALTEPRQPTE